MAISAALVVTVKPVSTPAPATASGASTEYEPAPPASHVDISPPTVVHVDIAPLTVVQTAGLGAAVTALVEAALAIRDKPQRRAA